MKSLFGIALVVSIEGILSFFVPVPHLEQPRRQCWRCPLGSHYCAARRPDDFSTFFASFSTASTAIPLT